MPNNSTFIVRLEPVLIIKLIRLSFEDLWVSLKLHTWVEPSGCLLLQTTNTKIWSYNFENWKLVELYVVDMYSMIGFKNEAKLSSCFLVWKTLHPPENTVSCFLLVSGSEEFILHSEVCLNPPHLSLAASMSVLWASAILMGLTEGVNRYYLTVTM